MTPGPESIAATVGRIVFSPPPAKLVEKLACPACPARPARACRDCRRVRELERQLYDQAEWECVQQIASWNNLDWEYGFIHFDKKQEMGIDASFKTGCHLKDLHDQRWRASEEARIFGKAGG